MLPDPLHPAVVHFPVALVMLLPLLALGALWAIRRGAEPLRAWGLVVGLAALLMAGSWVAVQTGEQQEEAVEAVVSEDAIHTHEEAAETFLWLVGGVLLLTGMGLVRGRVGGPVRVAATVATIGLAVAGWRVGHSGGELVYVHGAASAYVDAAGADLQGPDAIEPQPAEHDEDEERSDRD